MRSQQKHSDGVIALESLNRLGWKRPLRSLSPTSLCPGKMQSDKVGPEELLEQEQDAQHHTCLALSR